MWSHHRGLVVVLCTALLGLSHARSSPLGGGEAPARVAVAPEGWRIETAQGTVRVWTPGGYDASTATTVIFLHDYYVAVDDAWRDLALAEQFERSGLNAMFIVCEAPADSAERAVWTDLDALLDAVERRVSATLPSRSRVVAVGHGGGARAITPWLRNASLMTVVLVDASHVNTAPHYRWSRSRQHRLIEVAHPTHWRSAMVERLLPHCLVLDGSDLDETARAAADLYIRSRRGHTELVSEPDALPRYLRVLRVPFVEPS